MVIVDTSVWITFLRNGHKQLEKFLLNGEVVCHPYIIGELACGTIKNRKEILSLLSELPKVSVASHDEILTFIESNKLMGCGLGYIDVHLAASARLSRVPLWTIDRRLNTVAELLNVSYDINYLKK